MSVVTEAAPTGFVDRRKIPVQRHAVTHHAWCTRMPEGCAFLARTVSAVCALAQRNPRGSGRFPPERKACCVQVDVRMRLGWLGFLPVLAIVVGCSNASSDVASEGEDMTTSRLTSSDKVAFDYFLAKGLKNYQAAGIVGNLDQESGMNPTIKQFGGGPGRGIAQWSAGGRWDSDKNDNAVAFAAAEKKDVESLALQLDFIWHELTTFPSYGLADLKASKDVHGATLAFQEKFEACGDCVSTQRLSYAQNALNAYGADKVTGAKDAGSEPEPTPAPSDDAGASAEQPTTASSESGNPNSGSGSDENESTTENQNAELPPVASTNAGCAMSTGSASNGWLLGLAVALVALRRRRSLRIVPL